MNGECSVTILQMNDLHAYLEPHAELFWSAAGPEVREAGGLSRLAGLMNAIRAERPDACFAFDGGDTLHGTYAAVQTEGGALLPGLAAMSFDAMTAHWDFAYGPSRLRENVAHLPYPMLAANVFDAITGVEAFPPSAVIERGGLRVGVVGLAAVIVGGMPKRFHTGLRFTLGADVLPGHIARLRQEEDVELVVVLSHLGLPQDVKLAAQVEGIDVLLSAHTHNRLTAPIVVGRTIIIQSGSHGSFLGRLELTLGNRRVTDYRHALLTIGPGLPADPAVSELFHGALPQARRRELAEVVGRTEILLHRGMVMESTMDNLLLESLLDLTGAEIAFSNGWRYGAPVAPGPVTLNDLWNIIPVNPPVSICDLAGAEVWEMLEENLDHTFAADPWQQRGGYVKRALGLRALVKLENPRGQRLQELFIGKEPVKLDRFYSTAFVTAQGVAEKYGRDRQTVDTDAITALGRYFAASRSVSPDIRNTFIAV